MPQVAFSRRSTTEIPMQVLLFTAAACCATRARSGGSGPAFIAGFLPGLLRPCTSTASRSWSGCRSSSPSRGCGARPGAARTCRGGRARPAACCTGRRARILRPAAPQLAYLRSLRFDVQRLSAAAIIAVLAAVAFVAAVRWWARRA
jgi:hypothetical protein